MGWFHSRQAPGRRCKLHLLRCCVPLVLVLLSVTAAAGTAAPSSAPDEFLAVTLNIWHDQENWPARMAVILDTLRALRPDVVFLQEVLQKEGLPNQAQALAESLGCTFVFASVDPPGAPKRYGNAILTRHRILATHEIKLQPLDDYRVTAHARMEVRGRPVDAYVTHLHHLPEGSAIRARQVQDLLAFIDSTRGGGALVLGGDFNAAPDAPELRPVRERLTDSYAAVHPEQVGVLVTTLNEAKGNPPRRIDYLFADGSRVRAVAAEVFLDTPAAGGVWASDHFGVWTRFRWVK